MSNPQVKMLDLPHFEGPNVVSLDAARAMRDLEIACRAAIALAEKQKSADRE